jgi:bifunctional DNA-binding transcriptional regulator/antitoxin component of YhaV-PrlF toxin-antitoxin module
MSRQQGDITVLTKANSRSQSLRTTIPMSITRQFNLKEGDHLRWEIRAKESKLFIIVNTVNKTGD